MQGLNGIEAAKRIRSASPNTKVIFVTQNTENEIRSAALATGADAYVVKSESAGTLIPAIAAALYSERI
jgi:two-component system, NarL family, response regulator NreC